MRYKKLSGIENMYTGAESFNAGLDISGYYFEIFILK